jgi:hypothetical protein
MAENVLTRVVWITTLSDANGADTWLVAMLDLNVQNEIHFTCL